MSEESAERHLRTATATASAGVTAIDNLPPELLETICGFLDVRTLCTARLVCSQFNEAASRCIHSVEVFVLHLLSRRETTLNNFPNLSRVSVNALEDDLLRLACSPLGAAITHLRIYNYFNKLPHCKQNAASLPVLPLPNLVSLSLRHAEGHRFSFPQTLRELTLELPVENLQAANLAASLTNLMCLRIEVNRIREPFEAVTALTGLQRLEICCSPTLIPFIAKLTLLTHLQLRETIRWDEPSDLALASFSRLQNLVHLGVRHRSTSEEFHQLAASIGSISSLRSLDLCLPKQSALGTVCVTPFSQLTALRLECCQMEASFLPRFNLERLQDLSLDGVDLYPGAVESLMRATGLTHLELRTLFGTSVGLEELAAALARMSQLCALSFAASWEATGCSKAIAPLTGLTRLELHGHHVTTNAEVEVCLGLKKLRDLNIVGPSASGVQNRITPETLFAIAMLPELSTLGVYGYVDMWEFRDDEGQLRDDVRARFDSERHEKGWPPLDVWIGS